MIWGTGRHTPTENSEEYPPPPGSTMLFSVTQHDYFINCTDLFQHKKIKGRKYFTSSKQLTIVISAVFCEMTSRFKSGVLGNPHNWTLTGETAALIDGLCSYLSVLRILNHIFLYTSWSVFTIDTSEFFNRSPWTPGYIVSWLRFSSVFVCVCKLHGVSHGVSHGVCTRRSGLVSFAHVCFGIVSSTRPSKDRGGSEDENATRPHSSPGSPRESG